MFYFRFIGEDSHQILDWLNSKDIKYTWYISGIGITDLDIATIIRLKFATQVKMEMPNLPDSGSSTTK